MLALTLVLGICIQCICKYPDFFYRIERCEANIFAFMTTSIFFNTTKMVDDHTFKHL